VGFYQLGRFLSYSDLLTSHNIRDLSSLCGGILADPMGLGKSLTVLALIASDLVEAEDGLEVWNPGPTLLIVPLACEYMSLQPVNHH
jgi:hypothetical protein